MKNYSLILTELELEVLARNIETLIPISYKDKKDYDLDKRYLDDIIAKINAINIVADNL